VPVVFVRNRIFATLHHDRAWGMVELTPDQQRRFVSGHASVFVPEPGAWNDTRAITTTELSD
jgi:hypothetical protein